MLCSLAYHRISYTADFTSSGYYAKYEFELILNAANHDAAWNATISLMGGVGAALVLGSRLSGVLISLIILPLIIPILIFSVAAINASGEGMEISSAVKLLGALLIISSVFCPWVTAATLRHLTY